MSSWTSLYIYIHSRFQITAVCTYTKWSWCTWKIWPLCMANMFILASSCDTGNKGRHWKITASPHHVSVCFHSLLTISCASLWVTSLLFLTLAATLSPPAWVSLGLLELPFFSVFSRWVHINCRDSKGKIYTFASMKIISFSHFLITAQRPT